ncbi:BQ2448_7525 [Microbotryum intermedium]|uniref:GTP-binding protein n=1 Tax=Microbotryum intermedium TaxID=269621 RepID=A0A238FLE6_9BASI|nr:BQ2448_7525 [Microbotryum intermedium]
MMSGPSTATQPGAMAPMSMIRNGPRPNEEARPRLLFIGPRDAGKSSIRKVVFERMAPSNTFFIDRGNKSDDVNSFVSIKMWNLPAGPLDPSSWTFSFHEVDAVIFVLDASMPFADLIRKMALTMQKGYETNKEIQFEIFLHKIDILSVDHQLDTLQSLRDRLGEELDDLSPGLEASVHVFYHLTSVFDASIYEALSRVIQKLLPQQAFLERLLDQLVQVVDGDMQQCSMDKALIFDITSKLYLATDTTPLDSDTYVLCSDYVDLVGDFTLLYEPSNLQTPSHSRSPSMSSSQRGPSGMQSMSRIDPASSSSTPATSRTMALSSEPAPPHRLPSSRVKLGTGSTIAQWAITPELSLVALLRPHVMDRKGALIDYNVATFKDAVLTLFEPEAGAPHR